MARYFLSTCLIGCLSIASFAEAQDKPTTRQSAENRSTNLARYVIGGFGEDAQKTLGIKGVYSDNPPKFVITGFEVDSPAEAAGLKEYDWILEVDGSAIGKIRSRTYEPWEKYGRSGEEKIELLVSFRDTTGKRLYYYPRVSFQPIIEVAKYVCPSDGFTIPKPRTRIDAEEKDQNHSRYVAGNGFDAYSTHEIGTKYLSYSTNGATIAEITGGSYADQAGLKVGDIILEVDGAPIGKIGPRTFEGWRQYRYSKSGEVELCIAIPQSQGGYKYYYPKVKLKERQTSN